MVLSMNTDVNRASQSSARETSWRALVFAASVPEERRAVESLRKAGAVAVQHDTLAAQIADLLATRHPDRRLSADELAALSRTYLDGREPAECGVWVYYPWSCRLVHLLAEADFRELRTSRNRNLITAEEQVALRRLRIGVIGLSAGMAAALTLVQEEVGGQFRLADFDTLELSNLNRLRTGVEHLGLKKTVITAREVFAINPFAHVTLFSEGLTEHNLDTFLLDGGRLDLVIEECDDLFLKIRLRERARTLGIPVLMSTSDRGLIDIERFDLEPMRPLFHGLVGELDSATLRGLSAADKVPIVMKILRHDRLSARSAASLVDIETTLKTWPQLASAIALGGANLTDTARRIALGELRASGRYYVDLEAIVRDGAGAAMGDALSYDVEISPASQRIEAPVLTLGRDNLTSDEVRTLVAYGALAPSGGNVQPWRFVYRTGRLRCLHDVERSKNFLDFEHNATYVTFGAVAENLVLAAAAMGCTSSVTPFPVADAPHVVCDVHLRRGAAAATPDPLAAQLAQRVTNRRAGERRPLEVSEQRLLTEAAAARGARLQLVTDPGALAQIGDILGRGDRLRMLHETMHREMFAEVRWTREDVERTRDGLDVASLELTPTDLAGMRLVSAWSVMRVVGNIGAGRGLEKPSRKSIAGASAVGLLTCPGTGAASYLAGGRGLERLWLQATALGIALQPMTAIIYVFARVLRGGGAGLSASEVDALHELRRRLGMMFELDDGCAEIMLFRLAKVEPSTARALRRPVDEILTFES
ncbi:MAG: Rv1355c family protein [Myxococcota bacterium]